MRLVYYTVINNLKKPQTFSYGKFLRENPKATREERKKALQKFLDSTR